jgi:hypothetical protein
MAASRLLIANVSGPKAALHSSLWIQHTTVMLIILAFLVSVFARARLQMAPQETAETEVQRTEIEYTDLFIGTDGLNDERALALKTVLASHDLRIRAEVYGSAEIEELDQGLTRALTLHAYLRSVAPASAVQVLFVPSPGFIQAKVSFEAEAKGNVQ